MSITVGVLIYFRPPSTRNSKAHLFFHPIPASNEKNFDECTESGYDLLFNMLWFCCCCIVNWRLLDWSSALVISAQVRNKYRSSFLLTVYYISLILVPWVHMLVLADEPASRSFLRTLRVAKREFEYTVWFYQWSGSLKMGLMNRGAGGGTYNGQCRSKMQYRRRY